MSLKYSISHEHHHLVSACVCKHMHARVHTCVWSHVTPWPCLIRQILFHGRHLLPLGPTSLFTHSSVIISELWGDNTDISSELWSILFSACWPAVGLCLNCRGLYKEASLMRVERHEAGWQKQTHGGKWGAATDISNRRTDGQARWEEEQHHNVELAGLVACGDLRRASGTHCAGSVLASLILLTAKPLPHSTCLLSKCVFCCENRIAQTW